MVVVNLREKFCCEISLWPARGRPKKCVALSDRHWGISLMSGEDPIPSNTAGTVKTRGDPGGGEDDFCFSLLTEEAYLQLHCI
jgi:hypothetical protein